MPITPFFMGASTWMLRIGSKPYLLGRRSWTRLTSCVRSWLGSLTSIKKKSLSLNVRVSGMVVGDSVDFNSRDLILQFEITGESGETLPVVFNGPKPDQMRHDAEAIIDAIFEADSVVVW